MAERPPRIQRQRTLGWRMPEGAIYVGRPGVWGNPFWHEQHFHGVERSLPLYRSLFFGWSPQNVQDWPDSYASQVYATHRRWSARLLKLSSSLTTAIDLARVLLAGRPLACWCRLDAPCHADILLEIANT